jgi:hypothetical protein
MTFTGITSDPRSTITNDKWRSYDSFFLWPATTTNRMHRAVPAWPQAPARRPPRCSTATTSPPFSTTCWGCWRQQVLQGRRGDDHPHFNHTSITTTNSTPFPDGKQSTCSLPHHHQAMIPPKSRRHRLALRARYLEAALCAAQCSFQQGDANGSRGARAHHPRNGPASRRASAGEGLRRAHDPRAQRLGAVLDALARLHMVRRCRRSCTTAHGGRCRGTRTSPLPGRSARSGFTPQQRHG